MLLLETAVLVPLQLLVYVGSSSLILVLLVRRYIALQDHYGPDVRSV